MSFLKKLTTKCIRIKSYAAKNAHRGQVSTFNISGPLVFIILRHEEKIVVFLVVRGVRQEEMLNVET
jgi:hypothetical protein